MIISQVVDTFKGQSTPHRFVLLVRKKRHDIWSLVWLQKTWKLKNCLESKAEEKNFKTWIYYAALKRNSYITANFEKT